MNFQFTAKETIAHHILAAGDKKCHFHYYQRMGAKNRPQGGAGERIQSAVGFLFLLIKITIVSSPFSI